MIYKCSRHNVLAASIVNDEIAYLVLDQTNWIKDLMSLFGVGKLLITEHFLNTSYRIFMFFGKVRITCLVNHDSFVISVIHQIDLLPFRAFIGPMPRLSTPITLANPRLGVRISFALCNCGGCCCWWCRHKGFGRLLGWRLVIHHGTQLNPFATWWLFNWHWMLER